MAEIHKELGALNDEANGLMERIQLLYLRERNGKNILSPIYAMSFQAKEFLPRTMSIQEFHFTGQKKLFIKH
jgi:hypothetical protein